MNIKMQYMDDLEEQIDKLVKNTIGIEVEKNFSRGILSAEIKIPKNQLEKGITETDIKFEIIIDSYSPTLYPIPKLFCLTPYCFPNLADGRDLFKELRNCGEYRKGDLILTNLLTELLEFIKINYDRGGLIFCGNYYLDEKYEKRFFDNQRCKNITGVKQNIVLKGKNSSLSRILILSDVYFLLFKKDKSSKNSMILLFWSSFNNIEKIQKLSDNKTVILHWTTNDKTNNYSMNLSFENRNEFLNNLMERVKNFGMNFDIFKMNNQNQVEHQKFTSDFKLKKIEKEKENINTKNIGEEKLDEDENDKKREDIKKDNLEEKNEDLNQNININEIGNKI
jgi:hypothetical protein